MLQKTRIILVFIFFCLFFFVLFWFFCCLFLFWGGCWCFFLFGFFLLLFFLPLFFLFVWGFCLFSVILVWGFLGCFVPYQRGRSVYKSWLPEISCELQFLLVISLYRWISQNFQWWALGQILPLTKLMRMRTWCVLHSFFVGSLKVSLWVSEMEFHNWMRWLWRRNLQPLERTCRPVSGCPLVRWAL